MNNHLNKLDLIFFLSLIYQKCDRVLIPFLMDYNVSLKIKHLNMHRYKNVTQGAKIKHPLLIVLERQV
jgi:hypothetical protein